MACPRVDDIRVVVHHTRPEQRFVSLRPHRDVQNRERSRPSALHVAEVEEEGEHALAADEVEERLVRVVVRLVVLAVLVAQHLYRFEVVL